MKRQISLLSAFCDSARHLRSFHVRVSLECALQEGFVQHPASGLAAYRWFKRALLVAIFVTQFFAFYNNQITQVFGLAIVLLTYVALGSMINRELLHEPEAAGDETSSVPPRKPTGGRPR